MGYGVMQSTSSVRPCVRMREANRQTEQNIKDKGEEVNGQLEMEWSGEGHAVVNA
jgi:hypothetical protein